MESREQQSFNYKETFQYVRDIAVFWNTVPYTIPLFAVGKNIFMKDIPEFGRGIMSEVPESRERNIGSFIGNLAGIAGMAAQLYILAELSNHGNKIGGYVWATANVMCIPLLIINERLNPRRQEQNVETIVEE